MSDTLLTGLTAAGGNSRLARSMRARLQWRDRFGRWIDMGRGIKFKVRGRDGAARSVIGTFIGAKDANTGQVYVHQDPNGLPDGFYDVKSNNAQEFVANLSESQLAERGIELGKGADGKPVGERVAEDIPNINEMKPAAAPEGWVAQKGTFGGKKVIETDDGDFRIHYAGKDDTVLLEDHRANPGIAEPQRSVGEAFKKVSAVDVQREDSGDQAYTSLSEGNDAKLASRTRDEKIEQIKTNERTLLNEKAPLGAKQTAMTANETLKKELEAEGHPYDPEGEDSDAALAARKAAPADAPTPDATKPSVSTRDIDTSTFDVAPEGFLVPTGKMTNDISPEGLATFMTSEKEALGKGGARLVVDTNAGTAEIHNSADTLDNAKAQAGGIGADHVLDLAAGKEVSTTANGEKPVDPNSPDVNPNLSGDTSPEAPNAKDSNPDAVESQPANAGPDAPASSEPNGQAQQPESDSPAGADAAPAPAGDASSPDRAPEPAAAPSSPAAEPGSLEELKDRRAKVQAALDSAGDPKDIIALNEQADALDTRIASKNAPDTAAPAPDAPKAADTPTPAQDTNVEAQLKDISTQISDLQTQQADAQSRLNDPNTPQPDTKTQEELGRISDEISNLETKLDDLNTTEAPADSNSDNSNWAVNPAAPTKDEIQNAPVGAIIAEEHNESGDKRLYRKRDDGQWEQLKRDGSGEPAGFVTRGDSLSTQGSRSHYVSDMSGTRPVDPEVQRRRDEQNSRIQEQANPWQDETRDVSSLDGIRMQSGINEEFVNELTDRFRQNGYEGDPIQIEKFPDGTEMITDGNHRAEAAKRAGLDTVHVRVYEPTDQGRDAARTALVNAERRKEQPVEAPTPAPERPAYQEPGNADAATAARNELDAIDAEIENHLTAAESATDPQVQAEHLSRVRTLERQRKIQENALNRALGNEPMDFNGDLGWNMRNPDNRGELPKAPDNAPAASEPAKLPEATPTPTGDGTPAALDTTIDNPLNDALRKHLAGDTLSAEEQKALDKFNAEQANRTLEDKLADANAELALIDSRRIQLLTADGEWNAEELQSLDIARDEARANVQDIESQIAERDASAAPVEPGAPETVHEIGQRVLTDAENAQDILDSIDPSEGSGGAFDQKDDPNNPSSGHDNRIAAAKARMQGKDLTDEERASLNQALDSGILSDNQVSELERAIDSKPNRANTVTVARPATEQPEYMSTADLEVLTAEREDPNFVFDEDLTWRRVREEFPDAQELPNGDLILDTAENKGKRYETVLRRTDKNRFMVYVMETDQSGNRRAKRIGNTEWHSYEALERRITQGRVLIHSKSPAGSLARRKDQPTEFLGTKGFPGDDFLGDIGNPDAEMPSTGDEKFDRLLEVAANHIRRGDANLEDIEGHLQQLDPGANAINTIMSAIIGRAQDTYRPSGVNPFQMYDGETAEIGMHFDWTDWHQELNWWLPNGDLNPNRKPNPSYGQVQRGRVVGYVKENTDGKGHTYGDHVWVQMWDPATKSWGNWVKRSAQTLRRMDEGEDVGLPFFSKKEEWRSSPEALARRFRVPNAAPEEPVQTHERPRRDLPQSRRLRFTPRGSLSGYSNVPVPKDQPTIAGMIQREEIIPGIHPASEARPGMMIVRMDDNGLQHVDSIIRVENLGDGGYKIHAARPDGKGYADVDSFIVPGDANIALWSAPAIAAPEKPEPKNARRGDLVEFDLNGQVQHGVVAYDDDNGNLTVVTPGNEPIDILESNIRPATYQDISRDERRSVIELLDSTDIPQYIKDLVMRGILDPGLSRLRYDQILETLNSYGTISDRIREIDSILGMMGASAQERSDVRDYLDAK